MKHTVHLAYGCDDLVRVINPDSKRYGQIGRVNYAKVFAGENPQIEYVVLFAPKTTFGNEEGTFSGSSLELVTEVP